MALLITPTLLDSYDWYLKAPDSPIKSEPEKTWKEKAYEDLYNKLNRIFYSNKAVEMGNLLEKQVYNCCITENFSKGSDNFKSIVKEVLGADFQKKVKSIITIDNKEYCLYGKIDAFKKDVIIDLKTTSNYKGKENYLSKWQHKFYCYLTEVKYFKYIIAEFNSEYKIKNVHYVDYLMTNIQEIKKEIIERTQEFISFLEMYDDLKEAYYNKFNLYK